eukprot:gene25342-33078_t
MGLYEVTRAAYRAVVPPSLRDTLRARRKIRLMARYGAIYIHIPKTGGSSIVMALYGHGVVGHDAARDFYEPAKKAFQAVPSFSVVRDPWARCASSYRFIKNGGGVGPGARPVRNLDRYDIPAFSSFERFVEEWLPTANLGEENITLQPQHSYICDASGKILVDWLGRTERMQEVAEHLSDLTGRTVAIPLVNTSGPSLNYHSLYTSRMSDIVASVYSRDIELFGVRRAAPRSRGWSELRFRFFCLLVTRAVQGGKGEPLGLYEVTKATYRALVPSSLRITLKVHRTIGLLARHGAIFIHIPKTGGSSIALALYGSKLVGHRPARELYEPAKKAFRAVPSFSVVRDPWA